MAIDLSADIVLRWEDQDPSLVPILREGAIDVVLVGAPAAAFQAACRAAGIRVEPLAALKISDLSGVRAAGSAPAAFAHGLWPGVTSESAKEDEETASPSYMPWLDANGYRLHWLKTLCPDRPPALAYSPDKDAGLRPDRLVPYDTLELALAEAWMNGGNYVLAVEPRYRKALVSREPKALAAWRRLGRTARWLKQNKSLFTLPALPRITLLVDAGDATAEIANMMMRQNASPAFAAADSPPPPDPANRQVIVAAGLAPAPAPAIRDRILSHAEAGATVVTDRIGAPPWWRVPQLHLERDEPDREAYRLGRGTVVAYKQAIGDPSDFALDVIDLLTQPRRAVRVWNTSTVIATLGNAHESGRGRSVLRIVNYGSPHEWEVMFYVQGGYTSAVLLRPEAPQKQLQVARRSNLTEVNLQDLRRAAVVLLE